MVGRLVSCNVTLGGRCSGPATAIVATHRDGCGMPARVGRREPRCDTERFNRDLDRPARVRDARQAIQGEMTAAGRGIFFSDDSRSGAASGEPAHPILGLLSRRLTP